MRSALNLGAVYWAQGTEVFLDNEGKVCSFYGVRL